MHIKYLSRYIFVSMLVTVFFLGYSWFFRVYLEPQQYVDLAREHIIYDPYIGNWDDPDFELIWQDNRPLLRFAFYNDRPLVYGTIEVFIDPLTKQVTVDD